MSGARRTPFGFPVVAAAFGVQAVAVAVSIAAYPVFMRSLEAEFGVGRMLASNGVSALLVAGAIAAPWIGRALDRGSPRRVMSAGALALTAGLLGVSQAPSFGTAALFWVTLVGAGQAMLGALSAMTVLASWFVARRARMIAIAAMGGTVGAALSPPLCAFLIEQVGWRGAWVCLGIACSALALPMVLLGIVKRPEDVGAYPDGAPEAPPREAPDEARASLGVFLGERRFWFLAGGIALLGGTLITFATHVVPWAAERGISRSAAVGLLSLHALLGVVGKLLFGDLTDRLGARPAALVGVALMLAGWVGMVSAWSSLAFATSVACFALGGGCMLPCQAGYVAALFGRARFGRASGLLQLFSMGGILLLPPLVGFAFERTGSYAVPMTAMLGVVASSALLFGLVDVRAPRDLDAETPAAGRSAA